MSYSIYLTQMTIILAISHLGVQREMESVHLLFSVTVLLLLSLLGGAIYYQLVEKCFLNSRPQGALAPA